MDYITLKIKIISLLHILYILFVIVAPFYNSNYFLLLHTVLIPFMMLHWIFNNNSCAVTLAEKTMRKILIGKNDECISCEIIEPVYNFPNKYKKYTVLIYIITIMLWIISVGRLYRKYRIGEISSIVDLFTI